jgi:hypothetical protein
MNTQSTVMHRYSCIPLFFSMLLVCDVLHAAHPLITEDTGTQGKGNFQIELTSEWGYRKDSDVRDTSQETGAVLSYGLSDALDVVVSAPYVREKTADSAASTSVSGASDRALDVKWRFHESGSFSYGLKAGLTEPNGDEQKGLGNGKTGYSTFLIVAWDNAPWAVATHVGWIGNRNSQGDKDQLWHASISGWRQFGDKTKIVADTGMMTSLDASTSRYLGFYTLGLIYSFSKDIDIDVGIKRGLTRSDVDYALLAGLTFRF